ncbi:carboxymuconolactone decarboxylase family protein [Nonomuraea sp. SYSU D8015]|uniref:carboxymuconolactone decarboxylase family protein n=1 Tax=Nonomuraea sp. SYSU D8015 TaxID=2593644 RepID=UPI0016615B1A|nr:carboxymuconolactone decarboxylase family protein [Nonomuraea sp. SYSU D8015]
MVVPGAMQALLGLGKTIEGGSVPKQLLDLVYLRASQINGCGVCVDMHARDLKKNGESDERLWSVAAWREAPYFTGEERAALALAEAVTRLSDRPEAVSDEVWEAAADHFDEVQLGTLLMGIATVNLWNRLNASTRQVAGAWTG